MAVLPGGCPHPEDPSVEGVRGRGHEAVTGVDAVSEGGRTEAEVPLSGGRITPGVVRVGDTVRRPVGASSAFVAEVLGHLAEAGFVGAPRYLGLDAAGRDVLGCLPGWVPARFQHWTDATPRSPPPTRCTTPRARTAALPHPAIRWRISAIWRGPGACRPHARRRRSLRRPHRSVSAHLRGGVARPVGSSRIHSDPVGRFSASGGVPPIPQSGLCPGRIPSTEPVVSGAL